MSKRIKVSTDIPENSVRPAMDHRAREIQLAGLAENLVEKRLREGTASSQETTYYLKLGSERTRLEIERLEEENKLLRAKTEAIQSGARIEKLYEEAIRAFGTYQPTQTEDTYVEE